MPRYLTKSRFKLAVECPTKLFYTGKPGVYSDVKSADEFLQALADGGFQVGELAKVTFPDGEEVASRTHDEQVDETVALLQREEVTIFEGAIRFGGLFARIDILRKHGDHIELIEVKAKSFSSSEERPFRGRGDKILSEWLPYLQDVAFQRYVFGLAFPGFQVSSFLMLADKSKTCSVDRLNQRFKIRRTSGRPEITVMPGTDLAAIGTSILTRIGVDELVDEILRGRIRAPGHGGPLPAILDQWAQKYAADEKIPSTIGAHCGRCEFRSSDALSGLISGFEECWTNPSNAGPQDLAAGTVLDLWNFRGKQKLIDRGILSLREMIPEDLPYLEGHDGLSVSERQWMQISGEWPGGGDFYLDRDLMNQSMAKWTFPLHFIDFETATVAIPFFKGHRPYEMVAFQFSHHVVEADGHVAHRTEYLNTTPGENPNYDFVRKLEGALGEQGTVFMWSPHENTTLNAILTQLAADSVKPHDAERLMQFILSLTVRREDGHIVHMGSRKMVDLCRLAEKAFFHPATKGSSSIKMVLPAVMRSSPYLKQRYSAPIYGATGGVLSKNFEKWSWWQEHNELVIDPYRLLPPVFTDLPTYVQEKLDAAEDLEITQGGAATTAYARLQFEQHGPDERRRIEAALLRYCELDTLAMVLIYEAWRAWCVAVDPTSSSANAMPLSDRSARPSVRHA